MPYVAGVCGPMLAVSIDRETLRRRMVAARELRGIKRPELAALFVAEGFGKEDIARLERGAIAMTRPRRETLARLLDVPEHWFTAQDPDLFDMPADALGRIEDRLVRIETGMRGLDLNRQAILDLARRIADLGRG